MKDSFRQQIQALADQWGDDGAHGSELLRVLAAGVAAGAARPPEPEKAKEADTRVVGVPEGAHGDLPRPPTALTPAVVEKWFLDHGFINESEGERYPRWARCWSTRIGIDFTTLIFWPWSAPGVQRWEAVVRHHASGTNPSLAIGTCESLEDMQRIYHALRLINGYEKPEDDEFDPPEAVAASRPPDLGLTCSMCGHDEFPLVRNAANTFQICWQCAHDAEKELQTQPVAASRPRPQEGAKLDAILDSLSIEANNASTGWDRERLLFIRQQIETLWAASPPPQEPD